MDQAINDARSYAAPSTNSHRATCNRIAQDGLLIINNQLRPVFIKGFFVENDRELLEMAAKAAGLQYATKPDDGDELGRTHCDIMGLWITSGQFWWNPLTDGTAALCLAVKLRMDLILSGDVLGAFDNLGKQHGELRDPDPLSATRRAITRAAASTEIPV